MPKPHFAEIGKTAPASYLDPGDKSLAFYDNHFAPLSSLNERKRNEQPIALIAGILGMDGSLLAKLLIEKGYKVFGFDVTGKSRENIRGVKTQVELLKANLLNLNSLRRAIRTSGAHEVYNLGGLIHVGDSFNQPMEFAYVTGIGAINMLHAVQYESQESGRRINVLHPSTSELYGELPPPQTENTPLSSPLSSKSPYATAKILPHFEALLLRERYNLPVYIVDFFNHTHTSRLHSFVERGISLGAARIKLNLQNKIKIGNVYAVRDIGWAPEYMDGIWHMLQLPTADTFVLATGEGYAVWQMVQMALRSAGIKDWKNWDKYVEIDNILLRPQDVPALIGDPSKAKRKLGWEAIKKLPEIMDILVEYELKRIKS